MTAQPTHDHKPIYRTRPLLYAGFVASVGFFFFAVVPFPVAHLLHANITFFASLCAVLLLLCVPSVADLATKYILRLSRLLHRRGAFRSNAELEAPKFALIRILFGAFLAQRAFLILYFLSPGDLTNGPIVTAAAVNLAAAIFVTLGFFTQYSLAFLIVVQWHLGDAILGTVTLANDIAAMLATLLIFGNAGAHLSLDRWLIARGGILSRLLSPFYYSNGLPADDVLQIAKLIAVFSYWCVCMYSLSTHLNEPAWMNGTAGPYLLSSNFMSAFSTEVAQILGWGGWTIDLARLALWAMLPWYALILPFVLLGGVFRAYVIIWAILFFTLSLFVLQLGWLAHIEFLLLAALFWERRFIDRPGNLAVAYCCEHAGTSPDS